MPAVYVAQQLSVAVYGVAEPGSCRNNVVMLSGLAFFSFFAFCPFKIRFCFMSRLRRVCTAHTTPLATHFFGIRHPHTHALARSLLIFSTARHSAAMPSSGQT